MPTKDELMSLAGFDNLSNFRTITNVRKREGTVVPFDMNKIVAAITKAMDSVKEGNPEKDAEYIARNVYSVFTRGAMLYDIEQEVIPSVEAIQDAIIRELYVQGFTKTATHYVIYRENRAERRKQRQIPEHVRSLVNQSRVYLPDPMAEFTYYRTYSRWIEQEGRRETYIETVKRYMNFMRNKLGTMLNEQEYQEVEYSILNMEAMPSMRLMWAAGPAAERTNVAGYNCSFIAPTCFQDFGEILYILACGTGVGFSAESRNVELLPMIKRFTGRSTGTYMVVDSKEGWADALVEGMSCWFKGFDMKFDLSMIRPEGARLKTMGGRSSGPKPLSDLLNYVRGIIINRQGKRLTCRNVHDIICKIGDCIVAGGVRRSALISLSDLDDMEMRSAKSGYWYIENNQRQLANNSAVYEERPTDAQLMSEWNALYESHSGERGIFNRGSLLKQIPSRRYAKWQEMGIIDKEGVLVGQVGTNPCGEIVLLNKQFCNLTEVVCRAGDTLETLKRKVRIATILGTYQSMLTDFPYLSKEWKENCEAERLLGVSLTGQWDCPAIIMNNDDLLALLDVHCGEVNREYASRFGITESTCRTTGKPSGTLSIVVGASSGGHTRRAKYYLRRIRISVTEPLFHMLKEQNIPYAPENGQTMEDATTFVLTFPVKSPTNGPFVADLSALAQLKHWKKIKTEYTEHNPSVTINVREGEWIEVLHWIRQNWDIVGGLSFLPYDDHVYQQAPEEACDEETYNKWLKIWEGVDYSKIMTYEVEDNTMGSREFACVGGACEISR